MAALTCDICGGRLKMGKGKIAICESCGMEHSVERVREKIQEVKGTVHVDNAHLIENFLSMAQDAYSTENYAEAERYCNKVLENDPSHAEASFLKGKAVGWQSNLSNFRFKEAAVCFANAISATEGAECKDNLAESIESEFERLATALISVRSERFGKWPDSEETDGFYDDLDEVNSAISLYERDTGFTINRNRVFSNVATIVHNNINILVSTKILLEYKIDGSKSAYQSFVDKTDYCVRILEKTADLCDDDDPSDLKLYELIVSMLQSVLNNNTSDMIRDRWGAYHEEQRLSQYTLSKKQDKIKEIQRKIQRIKL